MITSQRKLHALIIRSSLAVSKYWLHIRNRLQRLPVFSPGDTCNNPRLTGCHGKYQEHKNSAIKLDDYNVGRAGQILTLPFYMAFLLTVF
jgi:hypothetical protein